MSKDCKDCKKQCKKHCGGECGDYKQRFKNVFTLQLSDGYGVPVKGTEFKVIVPVLKRGNQIELEIPSINFVTGPKSDFEGSVPDNGPYPPIPPVPYSGIITTAAGRLPEDCRPSHLMDVTQLAAADDGVLNQFYFFADGSSTTPIPIAGYIIRITVNGELQIFGQGTFGNMIPDGAHQLLPTTITYTAKEIKSVKRNIKVSTGATTTLFLQSIPLQGDGVRDSHVLDMYDGVIGRAWTDNSMVPDKTLNIINTMVRMSKLVGKEEVFLTDPIQLTDYVNNQYAWDTAVAINRADKNNIIVSWLQINNDVQTSTLMRAVSFDGGLTWPINGPTDFQPPPEAGGAGDNPGVQSDKYGNIWYLSSYSNPINAGFIMVSTDKGVTFNQVFKFPALDPTIWFYDFPQFCFSGGHGKEPYGLRLTTDLGDATVGNLGPVEVFIPINGLGQFGDIQGPVPLSQFWNLVQTGIPAASADGKVWLYGEISGLGPGFIPSPMAGIYSNRIAYKSPGQIDANWVGPWGICKSNYLNSLIVYPQYDSQPYFGYFITQKNIIYDDKRKLLYITTFGNTPSFSQNISLYLIMSGNNGQTWADPIKISNVSTGNRGFTSMALDPVTGDLAFGWYDARNDETNQYIEYYGCVIPRVKLDMLTEELVPVATRSNPVYSIPPANVGLTIEEAVKKIKEKKQHQEKAIVKA